MGTLVSRERFCVRLSGMSLSDLFVIWSFWTISSLLVQTVLNGAASDSTLTALKSSAKSLSIHFWIVFFLFLTFNEPSGKWPQPSVIDCFVHPAAQKYPMCNEIKQEKSTLSSLGNSRYFSLFIYCILFAFCIVYVCVVCPLSRYKTVKLMYIRLNWWTVLSYSWLKCYQKHIFVLLLVTSHLLLPWLVVVLVIWVCDHW